MREMNEDARCSKTNKQANHDNSGVLTLRKWLQSYAKKDEEMSEIAKTKLETREMRGSLPTKTL